VGIRWGLDEEMLKQTFPQLSALSTSVGMGEFFSRIPFSFFLFFSSFLFSFHSQKWQVLLGA
jgi:hypothetical protein